MSIDINKYKTTYSVMECAGITNTDMSDGENRLDVHNKICSWVNNDSTLNQYFEAKRWDNDSSNHYYNTFIAEKNTGLSTVFGHYTSSSHSFIKPGYWSNGGTTASTITSGSNCSLANLRFMLIKGSYGIIYGFYSDTLEPQKYVTNIVSICSEDNNTERYLGISCFSSPNTYFVRDNLTSNNASSFLSNPSSSSITALSSFLVPSQNILSENCRIMDGHRFTGLTFFEADNKIWCAVSPNTSYKGMALLLEDKTL